VTLNIAALLAEFHEAFGQPFGRPDLGNAELRRKLHVEEHEELIEALVDGDLVAIAQELADVVYVAYGTAHTLGIPLNAVVAEVHRANMSKFDESGRPILRQDGKVLKSDRFVPADVAGVLWRERAR
jgi:predicted HAD superfamily Cof-like phosphohydrolase